MWLPALRLLVLQVAVLELAEPAGRATAEQPVIDDAPSLKLTDPVGLAPVTVAVKVTFAPTSDGLVELASEVPLEAVLTTCARVVLVEPLLPASPP